MNGKFCFRYDDFGGVKRTFLANLKRSLPFSKNLGWQTWYERGILKDKPKLAQNPTQVPIPFGQHPCQNADCRPCAQDGVHGQAQMRDHLLKGARGERAEKGVERCRCGSTVKWPGRRSR